MHAAPAEHGRPAGVHDVSWRDYALANDVRAVSVHRVARLEPDEGERMASAARSFIGRAFNSAFLLSTASGVYCTQLALAACAAVDPTVLDWVEPTTVALLSDPVFLPDSILTWPRLLVVAST